MRAGIKGYRGQVFLETALALIMLLLFILGGMAVLRNANQ